MTGRTVRALYPRSTRVKRDPRLWAGVALVVAVMVLAVVVARRGSDGGAGRHGAAGGSTGAFVGGDLHTLVVDPSNPDRLFVGGHEAAAVSSDGGRTWGQVASLRNADAMGWAFDGDLIWMGGHPGLRRSSNGGRTFVPGGGELESADVHALGGGAGVLYAASPSRGLLTSSDGGQSWQVRSPDGTGFMGVISVDERRYGDAGRGRRGPSRTQHGQWEDVVVAPGAQRHDGRRSRRTHAVRRHAQGHGCEGVRQQRRRWQLAAERRIAPDSTATACSR